VKDRPPEGLILKKTKAEHGLIWIKAAVSAVPGVGGPIASLIGDYVPTHTERAVEEATRLLTDRLSEIEERIDPETVNKDEFAELFKSCYLVVVRTHQEEKLRGAANLLANALLRPGDGAKLEYTELDHFVRCLDAISIGGIRVLGVLYNLVQERVPPGPSEVHVSQLRKRLPPSLISLVESLLFELNALHLVFLPPLHKFSGPRGTAPGALSDYEISITSWGRKFVERVLGAAELPSPNADNDADTEAGNA